MQAKAQAQSLEQADAAPRHRKYTPELGEEIAGMVASGIAIDDAVCAGAVVMPGIATRLGIHPSTFYEWLKRYPEFSESVARAREESAHRISDKMMALADVALADPTWANACRAAADIYKWQAAVRNRAYYGDKTEVTGQIKGGCTVIVQSYSNAMRETSLIEQESGLPALTVEVGAVAHQEGDS